MADSSSILGCTISHYRLIEKLAGGGMGVVHKAEDTRLHRAMSLKFMPGEMSHDLAALERFRREAQAASALNLPSICTIYETHEHDGQFFFAMEFFDGETLKLRIESGLIKTDSLAELTVQIADGLTRRTARATPS